MSNEIYTVGHSIHAIEMFISLLTQHRITVVCDVRSSPYSRINPQFNRESLKQSLSKHAIGYLFLGEELGARSKNPACYVDGKARYELIAKTKLFADGIERLKDEMTTHSVALMCAEREPLNCHRTILVGRALVGQGFSVQHILDDGSLEGHEQTLSRLLHRLGLPEGDLFQSRNDCIEAAYEIESERMSYEGASDLAVAPPK